jgi:hypothetical protein
MIISNDFIKMEKDSSVIVGLGVQKIQKNKKEKMNYSKVKNGYEIYSNGNLNEFKI